MSEAAVREIFFRQCSKNNADPEKINAVWKELLEHYNSEGRYYHNLSHIHHLLTLADTAAAHFHDADSVYWAIFFHDLIYDVNRKDNEERSALSALKYLNMLKVPVMKILKIQGMILATKTHMPEEDEKDADLDLLLDLDLSVLGSAEDEYVNYMKNIRKEYLHVPETEFMNARKKVIQNFLERAAIYRTPYFSARLEEQARKNLRKELVNLH